LFALVAEAIGQRMKRRTELQERLRKPEAEVLETG
jgi:hypothetical protein